MCGIDGCVVHGRRHRRHGVAKEHGDLPGRGVDVREWDYCLVRSCLGLHLRCQLHTLRARGTEVCKQTKPGFEFGRFEVQSDEISRFS